MDTGIIGVCMTDTWRLQEDQYIPVNKTLAKWAGILLQTGLFF